MTSALRARYEADIAEADVTINGTYDIAIDGAVDDIKSASDWSYRNKFKSFASLKESDSFGYVGQLAGYAQASGLKAGGWWVINKANGSFKYIPANGLDMVEELYKIIIGSKVKFLRRQYQKQILAIVSLVGPKEKK